MTLNRIAARLLVAVFILADASSAFGACKPSHYHQGRAWADNASDILLGISIRLEDFAPDRLVCLAEALRQKYPERNVAALIFSSRQAAQGYFPGSIDPPPRSVTYQSKLHGYYSYNKEKH
jgi:hypothetical protein